MQSRRGRALVSVLGASLLLSACAALTGLDRLEIEGNSVDAPDTSTTEVSVVDAGADARDAKAVEEADVIASPKTYPELVLSDKPVAYWRFSGDGGTNVPDQSGHGNDLVLSGSIALNAPGAIAGDSDTAARFDGTSGCAFASASLDFANTSPFTLEAWAVFGTPDAIYRHIFNKDMNPPSTREQFGVFYQVDDGLGFERHVRGGQSKVLAPVPTIGQFAHVVGTYDGAKLALYVNAVLVGTRSDTATQVVKSVPFFVGCQSAMYGHFRGVIDEVAVYPTPLAESRVKRHYDFARGVR